MTNLQDQSPGAGRPKKMGMAEFVLLMALMMALQASAIDTMLPALPLIAAELGVTATNHRQLVVGLYILASGIGCLFSGMLADRFGRRPVALFALVAYVVLSIGCALATEFHHLLILRMLQGLLGAGVMLVPVAIIRDRYEGDRMARLMSLITAVFVTVPVLAPSIGQMLLWLAGWRWIFLFLAAMGCVAGIWFYLRMPETLRAEYRQPLSLRPILTNMGNALFRRSSLGYVFGAVLVTSGIFGYINSSQQLIAEHFHAGEAFAPIFGASAAAMILSSLTNASIVEKFGARRVSHTGLLVFIALGAAQVWFALGQWQSLAWFFPLIAANMAVIGFLSSNFSSIAMQPFAEAAGVASSVQMSVRLFGAGGLGILIGQAYDGTSLPLALALLIMGSLSLLLVLYSEQGRLFRRLNPPSRPMSLP